jgi:hypothetical protein
LVVGDLLRLLCSHRILLRGFGCTGVSALDDVVRIVLGLWVFLLAFAVRAIILVNVGLCLLVVDVYYFSGEVKQSALLSFLHMRATP